MKSFRSLLLFLILIMLASCGVPGVNVSVGDDTSNPNSTMEVKPTDAPKPATENGISVVKPAGDDTTNTQDNSDAGIGGKKPASTDNGADAKLPATLEEVMAATVQIGVLDATWQEVGTCTGSIIDPRGLILTNFHCIGDNETGQYNNADGIDNIYITLNPRNPPKFQFIAQTVDADAGKDIAILRIIATTNGEPPANCLNLPAITLDTASQVEIGQKVTSVGYPGVGGDTLTIASGQVVGFDEYSMSGQGRTYEAIKYDAADSAGISGGPIINEQFEQVAIAHAGRSDQDKGGKLSLARPIELAQDMINSANLVRIPGCNGSAAAQLSGPAQPEDPTTNNGGNTDPTTSETYDISGLLLDSVSSEPIVNGYVVILKPEYDWADVDYDDLETYVLLAAETDANGEYTLSVTDEMATSLMSFGLFADNYDTWLGDEVDITEIYDKETDRWIDIYMDATK
jgi:S1-C subfamily serine protease